MNFKALESPEKLRGGYYTPLPIAEFLTRWAIAPNTTRILEPSCGDGRFIEALNSVVSQNGQSTSDMSVDAVELLEGEAKLARERAERLEERGVRVRVHSGDFFSWIDTVPREKKWDAVLGNPPYIRYQYFDDEQQDRTRSLFLRANLPFTKLTNAWVGFVLASVMHLSPGGRIAMIIPAEISYIIHAQGLRLLLEQEMDYLRLIHLREIVFDGTLQGTNLFLGIKRADRPFQCLQTKDEGEDLLPFPKKVQHEVDFKIYDLNGIDELDSLKCLRERQPLVKKQRNLHGNWMMGLLNEKEYGLLEGMSVQTKEFNDIAEVRVGIVTGANKFFCVDDHTVKKYNLNRISYPMLARSELIRGVTYTAQDHVYNALLGKGVHFLAFPEKDFLKLPQPMRKYIMLGEDQSIHERYKCRIREPWYVVPYVWCSQLSMLKRCYSFPRLVSNELGAYSTDTAYRITMREEFNERGKDFVFSFLNSYTLLQAELGGRHYGGGVLELVPSEIRALRVPITKVSKADFKRLDRMVRKKEEIGAILDFTDEIVLRDGLGMNRQNLGILRNCYLRLRGRRFRKT